MNFDISICIPTYNRSKEFERLMIDLAPQIYSNIEIVIRDDSSDNLTELVVNKYFNIKNPNVVYIKGKKIGADAAQLFLLEKARGKFVWFFGDDDQITKGAVNYVLNVINKNNVDYIWINYTYEKNKTALPVKDDRYFNDNNEVIVKIGRSMGFLSSIFVKREKAIEYLEIAKDNIYGFAFAILIPVFGILKPQNKLYLINKPLVINNPTTHEEIKKITNNNGVIKNDGFYVYGIYLKNIIKIFENNFKKKSLNKFIKKNFRQTWMGMVVGYCGEWDSPVNKKKLMIYHYWRYPEAYFAVVLLSLPKSLLKILYLAYLKIKRMN